MSADSRGLNPAKMCVIKLRRTKYLAFLVISFGCGYISHAAEFFVSRLGGNIAPFAGWASAATNIQDAIDAASAGDVIWVTNGIYSAGGKIMGGMSNRIAVDKPLTVQSVNGFLVTTIQGAWDPATNGPLSMRCAAVTNGAVLKGFTLTGGATRESGSPVPQKYGGGVWGSSSNALIQDCLILSNIASVYGGGAYQGKLRNCKLIGNQAVATQVEADGGGAAFSTLIGCAVITNSCRSYGGGVFGGFLINCTVTGNKAFSGGGVFVCKLTNCIVRSNSNMSGANYDNYNGSTLNYCSASPLASGLGNIDVDPGLLNDGVHIPPISPCRGMGTNGVLTGTDIDGQPWADPPSLGCDEWLPTPVIAVQPTAKITIAPFGFSISSILTAGQEPYGFWWTKDGAVLEDDAHYGSTHSTNLLIKGISLSDVGNYQVIASNAFGMATSTVVRVMIRCVDAASTGSVSPYTNWVTAATNIQDAIDISDARDFVLVTNGVYVFGGRVMSGDLTNRVALTKPLTVASMNGPDVTVIQGVRDPQSTNGNGPLSVRCAWLAEGTTLCGFTLQDGATRTGGDVVNLQSGGGVLAMGANALTLNCIIRSNAANYAGGGTYGGVVRNSRVMVNTARLGGGSSDSTLINCFVEANTSTQFGGGTYYGTLLNSTVISNSSPTSGGIHMTRATNSIIYYNFNSSDPLAPNGNFAVPFSAANCCTTLGVAGLGMIYDPPQLIDGFHLASTSPCRGAGNVLYSSGADIDEEPWMNPPSIGCDEFWESGITGPLAVDLTASLFTVAERGSIQLQGTVHGRASRVAWEFGDGSVLTNASYPTISHSWSNAGDYTVTFTAYNMDNSAGVSTNLMVHIIPLVSPPITPGTLNGSSFSISFPGQPGVRYIVEQTTNLAAPITWQRVVTISGTGTLNAVDIFATNAMRFYRSRVQ